MYSHRAKYICIYFYIHNITIITVTTTSKTKEQAEHTQEEHNHLLLNDFCNAIELHLLYADDTVENSTTNALISMLHCFLHNADCIYFSLKSPLVFLSENKS